MNREERRNEKFRKRSPDPHDPKRILSELKLRAAAKKVLKDHTDPQEINSGDKVKMDVSLVKSRKSYPDMNEKYKEFVENNGDKVFTARVEGKNMVSFEEEPTWLFWSGDLIKVSSGDADA